MHDESNYVINKVSFRVGLRTFNQYMYEILLNGITDNPPPDLGMVIKLVLFVLQADSKDWFPMVRNPQHFF